MKIFICGQRSFGKAVLKRLYEDGHEITGVAPPPQKRLKDKMVGYALCRAVAVVYFSKHISFHLITAL